MSCARAGLAAPVVALAMLSVVSLVGRGEGHPLAPALLEIREVGSGESEVVWKTPVVMPDGAALAPRLPVECRGEGRPSLERSEASVVRRQRLRCDGDGWAGRSVGIDGLAESKSDALVRVVFADGRVASALLDGGRTSFLIPQRPTAAAIARDYCGLGIDHLLSGLDHLLFVLGLVLLIHAWRPLLATVTAFTLGHSVTLAAAVLGYVHLPAAPIELAIAASIVVLAVELARADRGRATVLSRRPWLVAAAFGLLHGFGFAGALAETGLPAGEIPLALLAFNVGIELGQIGFVVVVLVLRRAVAALRLRQLDWMARLPAYVIGSLAVFWCFERAAALLGRNGQPPAGL